MLRKGIEEFLRRHTFVPVARGEGDFYCFICGSPGKYFLIVKDETGRMYRVSFRCAKKYLGFNAEEAPEASKALIWQLLCDEVADFLKGGKV